jgi:hypothetical protein
MMSDDNKGIPEWLVTYQNPYHLIQGVGSETLRYLAIIHGYASLLLMIEQGKTEPNKVNREQALLEIIRANQDITDILKGMREIAAQLESKNSEE